jgi:hypothetical protein
LAARDVTAVSDNTAAFPDFSFRGKPPFNPGGFGYADAPRYIRPFVCAGFLGGLSTFSAFGYETVCLIENRRYLTAAGSAALNLGLTAGLCALGLFIAGVIGRKLPL